VARGTPRIMSQDAKVWRAEIVEVEIRQSCGFAGPVKTMPHILPPMSGRIGLAKIRGGGSVTDGRVPTRFH
jgi:hypothetical protein